MSGRKFGFECELTSGATATIYELSKMGLANTDHLHGYHCRCDDCRHNDVEAEGGPLFRGQTDCTVDGEIISSILTHGADSADRAFTGLASVLAKTRATVDTNAGFHVHVDKRDLDTPARLRVYRMFLRYQDSDLAELASARFSEVRGYNPKLGGERTFISGRAERNSIDVQDPVTGFWLNRLRRPSDYTNCNGTRTAGSCCRWCNLDFESNSGNIRRMQEAWDRLFADAVPHGPELPPEVRFWEDDALVPDDPGKASWLNGHGAGNGDKTMEFRLWNATRVEWRMRLAAGVSVAIMDAAKAGVNVKKDDTRSLEEVLDPFLTDDTWAAIIRQRSFKDAA